MKCFPSAFCQEFASDLPWKCLIHFGSMLYRVRKNTEFYSSPSLWVQFLPNHLKKLSLFQCLVLLSLPRIRWFQLCRFISRSSFLLCWSTHLFLCECHAGFVMAAPQHNLKSGIQLPPIVLFCTGLLWLFRIVDVFIWILWLVMIFVLFCISSSLKHFIESWGRFHWD